MWLRRIFYGIALVSTPSAVAAYGLSGIILGVSVLYFYTLDHQKNDSLSLKYLENGCGRHNQLS